MIKLTRIDTSQSPVTTNPILINPDRITTVVPISDYYGYLKCSYIKVSEGYNYDGIYVVEDLDTILDLCLDFKLGGLLNDTMEPEGEDDDDKWWAQ